MRTDESLERDGRPDERRVGRLEAVALERPEVELVVEPVLGVELGHEVLHGRRRAGRAVRRAMRRVRGVRQVRHGLFEADVVAELQGRPVALGDEDIIKSREHALGQVQMRPVHRDEDIVDAAPHHVELWSEMMVKLDLWKAPDPERVRNRAAASTHAVHATLPLSEVVANWDELAEALGGSVFEDMLA